RSCTTSTEWPTGASRVAPQRRRRRRARLLRSGSARALVAAAVVPDARPRRERQQDARAALSRDRTALRRVEPKELAGGRQLHLSARLDPRFAGHDEEQRS